MPTPRGGPDERQPMRRRASRRRSTPFDRVRSLWGSRDGGQSERPGAERRYAPREPDPTPAPPAASRRYAAPARR
ncbi:MAG: hypothetical protein ACREQM_08990, partial [Candidatus Dormibacteraceae bacterium]